MTPPTVSYFFLGANSESGFYSLYDEFCAAPSDLLHIIKGGPGTGKSTFMKRIGKAAEAHGLQVEYILCSGDPDSLDGIYIPALHMGWADGTAPHVLEPHHFGINAVYEDLGRFCNTSALANSHASIANLTEAYRQCYKDAYQYLNAAAAVRKSTVKQLSSQVEDKIRKRAHSKIKRELHPIHSKYNVMKRFISAISCNGIYTLDMTINTMCNRMCVLSSNHGIEQIFFDEMHKVLEDSQVSYYSCPNPLSPNLTECIILPEEGLCFVSDQMTLNFHGTTRTIHLDRYLSKSEGHHCSVRSQLYSKLLDAGIAQLYRAKLLHDELEQCYRPALDIPSLSEYTETVIHKLFH